MIEPPLVDKKRMDVGKKQIGQKQIDFPSTCYHQVCGRDCVSLEERIKKPIKNGDGVDAKEADNEKRGCPLCCKADMTLSVFDKDLFCADHLEMIDTIRTHVDSRPITAVEAAISYQTHGNLVDAILRLQYN